MGDSTYKLTYFNLPGLGEGIRFIFAYADVDYEDNRIEKADWPAMKEAQLFQQLPILEVDGKVLAQSNAIARFLGKRFGLTPDDEFKDAELEALVDHVRDLMTKVRAELITKTPEAKKESDDAIEFTFSRLDTLAADGFFYGSEPSWVDVSFAGLMDTMQEHKPGLLKPYPNLIGICEKIKSKDSVKKYIEKRPASHVHV